ncbi:bacteriocin-like protein [Chryseobacterium elymi]|uniref:bacteriocin-like protein n=1 Tax=Chryseobacterium elymi TaxID=395936 RepID=UPI00142DAE04|nr:hypothetical protein [Chryseobacterium elymi]
MKNLKKLNKNQLKSISGAGGIKLPEPEFCIYYCSGTVICAACGEDFHCPDDSM